MKIVTAATALDKEAGIFDFLKPKQKGQPAVESPANDLDTLKRIVSFLSSPSIAKMDGQIQSEIAKYGDILKQIGPGAPIRESAKDPNFAPQLVALTKSIYHICQFFINSYIKPLQQEVAKIGGDLRTILPAASVNNTDKYEKILKEAVEINKVLSTRDPKAPIDNATLQIVKQFGEGVGYWIMTWGVKKQADGVMEQAQDAIAKMTRENQAKEYKPESAMGESPFATQTAGGKKTLKISQAQWEFIGEKAGWLVKEAGMGEKIME